MRSVCRVGCVGLPLSSPKFAVVPCQVDCGVEESNKMVKGFIPTISRNLHCISRFFAAAILYHTNFLKQISSLSNHFLSSLLLTSSESPALMKKKTVNYACEVCSNISVHRGENDSLDSELSSFIVVLVEQQEDTPWVIVALWSLRRLGHLFQG